MRVERGLNEVLLMLSNHLLRPQSLEVLSGWRDKLRALLADGDPAPVRLFIDTSDARTSEIAVTPTGPDPQHQN